MFFIPKLNKTMTRQYKKPILSHNRPYNAYFCLYFNQSEGF